MRVQAAAAKRAMPGWLVLMGCLTALGPLSIDMYLPAFKAIAQGLQVSYGEVERTLAAYLLGLSLSQLLYGPLADRYGRKRPLIAGLVLYMIGSACCGLAGSIEALTVGRVVQAMGGAAGVVIPRAVVRDHYDTQGAARALSLLMLVMGIAPVLAPLIGGQLVGLTGWRGIFGLLLLVALSLLLAILVLMRESLDPARVTLMSAGSIARAYGAMLMHRRFMAYSLASGFASAALFSYIVSSPRVFLDIYHLSPAQYGLLFGVNAVSLIVGAQVSAALLRRAPPARILAWAQALVLCAALTALALTWSGALTMGRLVACLMITLFGLGFISPNATALALEAQGARLGSASALMGTLQLGVGALAGIAISLWHAPTALPLVSALAACAALSALAGWWGRARATLT